MTRAIVVPATTSSTKWFAVTTTASTIITCMTSANARRGQARLARKTMTPSRTFHPAWKLGIAAYSLTSAAGSTVR